MELFEMAIIRKARIHGVPKSIFSNEKQGVKDHSKMHSANASVGYECMPSGLGL